MHVQPARKYDERAGVSYEAEVLFVGDDVKERKVSWRPGDIIVTVNDYPDFRDDGWVIGTGMTTRRWNRAKRRTR